MVGSFSRTELFTQNESRTQLMKLVEIQISAPHNFNRLSSFLLYDAERNNGIIAWPSSSVKCRLLYVNVLLFLCNAPRLL